MVWDSRSGRPLSLCRTRKRPACRGLRKDEQDSGCHKVLEAVPCAASSGVKQGAAKAKVILLATGARICGVPRRSRVGRRLRPRLLRACCGPEAI